MDHFIFNDISGAGDPLAFDGVHRTLDASGASGPARITLTGFADEATGSAFDDHFIVTGDVRVQVWDAWRGGLQDGAREFDGYDVVLSGGEGADRFDFIPTVKASVGRFGYDTPGDVFIRDFDVAEDTIGLTAFAGVFGGLMPPSLTFTEEGQAVIGLQTYTGFDMGTITLDHVTSRDVRQAFLDGELEQMTSFIDFWGA